MSDKIRLLPPKGWYQVVVVSVNTKQSTMEPNRNYHTIKLELQDTGIYLYEYLYDDTMQTTDIIQRLWPDRPFSAKFEVSPKDLVGKQACVYLNVGTSVHIGSYTTIDWKKEYPYAKTASDSSGSYDVGV